MKRSDMLKQIKAVFRNNLTTYHLHSVGDITFGKMSELLSEEILTHIELLGMQPPEIKRNLTLDEAIASELTIYDVVFEHAWENEDDK